MIRSLIAAGKTYWYQDWKKEELLGPLPPPPDFSEPSEAVRERIVKVIGKVSVPREVRVWHPGIDRLLRENETRREKQRASGYPISLDEPRFDLPFERRRLRILNSLFLAVGRMNGKPSFYGHKLGSATFRSISNMSVSLSINQNNRVGAVT